MKDEDFEIFNINDVYRSHYLEIKEDYLYNEQLIKEVEEDINSLMLCDKVNNCLENMDDSRVVKYLSKCSELDLLKKNRRMLYKKMSGLHQKICEHPAFFVINNYYDEKNDEIYSCCCIECGKRMNKLVCEFGDEVIIHPKDRNNATEEYKKYKKDYKRLMRNVF